MRSAPEANPCFDCLNRRCLLCDGEIPLHLGPGHHHYCCEEHASTARSAQVSAAGKRCDEKQRKNQPEEGRKADQNVRKSLSLLGLTWPKLSQSTSPLVQAALRDDLPDTRIELHELIWKSLSHAQPDIGSGAEGAIRSQSGNKGCVTRAGCTGRGEGRSSFLSVFFA